MSQFIDDVNQRTQLVGQNRMELLLFHLGGAQTFGINVFKVREVIPSPRLRHIPGSMGLVRGVATLRGGTVPIIDLGRAMDLRGGTATDNGVEHKVVVTEFNRSVQGFWVSAVDRIVNVNWQDVKPPPRGTGRESFLVAVTEIDNRLVEIIDVERVLALVNPLPSEVSAGVREEAASAPGPHRVIVVDDSVVARKQIEVAIRGLGYEYVSFKDGQEAIEFLEQEAAQGTVADSIALVISDIEMPRMDGYTLTSRIREHSGLSDLKVLLHSSLSGAFNTDMIRRVGADAFLPKFHPDELARAVLEQLRGEEP